jgi:hypothetical protein
MRSMKHTLWIAIFSVSTLFCFPQIRGMSGDTIPYDLYPALLNEKPDLPSPYLSQTGIEYVTAINKDGRYAIMEVSLSNDRDICQQLIVDTLDFPYLARTGLHDETSLNSIVTITGRSLNEITDLGRPLGLSYDGFLAQDEDIFSVIKGDELLVRQLGLTHPQLAKPLFHVLNMMDWDLSLGRWNMAKHQWDHIRCFLYNDKTVFVEAYDTKGGQQSIFDDGIGGAFHIKLWREFEPDEMACLKKRYGNLTEQEFQELQTRLSMINTGEMEPQYIMRYGFYEGHTYWRTDPIALSFIFGIKSLQELDRLFNGGLHKALSAHYIR